MNKLYNKTTRFFIEFIGNYISIPIAAWLVLPLIGLDTFITAICLNVSVFFTKVHHLNPLTIGEAISLYYIGSFFGSLIGGSLTIKMSSMKLSGICGILLSFSFLFLLQIKGTNELKIIMSCMGFLNAIIATSNLSSLIKTAEGNKYNRLKLINLELVIFNLSFSLSAFVLIDLNIQDINYILHTLGIALGVFGLYAVSLKNKKFSLPPKIINKEKLCKSKNLVILIILLLSVMTVGLIFSMIKVIYAPTVENRFGDNGISVLVASINPWVIFLFQPFIINRLKNTENAIFMGVGGLIIGLGYFLFGISTSFYTTILFLIFLTFGEIMFCPVSKSMAVSLFDEGREGFAIGVWRAVFLGSGFFGPIISGWITENYGTIAVWELCGILGLACLILSLMLNKCNKSTRFKEGECILSLSHKISLKKVG